jgi:hypothetical protein
MGLDARVSKSKENLPFDAEAGFYKRGCQEKTLSPIPRKVFSDIQPSLRWQGLVPERRSDFPEHLGGVVPCGIFAPASSGLAMANHGSI